MPCTDLHRSEYPSLKRHGETVAINPCRMYVGGLARETNECVLHTYFSQYGRINHVLIQKERTSNRSRCFGFVTFNSPHEVDKALNYAHIIDQKSIDARRAMPRELHDESIRFQISNIHPTIRRPQLYDYFVQFGDILDCNVILYRDNNKSTGSGSVTFANQQTLQKILEHGTHTLEQSAMTITYRPDPEPSSSETQSSFIEESQSQSPSQSQSQYWQTPLPDESALNRRPLFIEPVPISPIFIPETSPIMTPTGIPAPYDPITTPSSPISIHAPPLASYPIMEPTMYQNLILNGYFPTYPYNPYPPRQASWGYINVGEQYPYHHHHQEDGHQNFIYWPTMNMNNSQQMPPMPNQFLQNQNLHSSSQQPFWFRPMVVPPYISNPLHGIGISVPIRRGVHRGNTHRGENTSNSSYASININTQQSNSTSPTIPKTNTQNDYT